MILLRSISTAVILSAIMVVLSASIPVDSARTSAPTLSLGLPTSSDSAQSLARLRRRLDAIFTSPTYRRSASSVMVMSLRTGQTLYARNAEVPLTPASTTKLFSTATAFHLLGPDGSITTDVRTDGFVDAKGTLNGNLYLVGHGDALLTVTDIEQLADHIRRKGIKRISGSVYGDGTFFDSNTERASYSGDGEYVEPLPPITALSMHRNTVTVLVSASASGRVTAQCVPASDAFTIRTSGASAPVATGKRRRRARGARLSVSATATADGQQIFTIAGSPGANRTRSYWYQIKRSDLACAGALAVRLRAEGILIDGTTGVKRAPISAHELASFRRPLVEFASVVNKRSDNYLAEHLFKLAGAQCGEHHNTAERARRAMLETLDSLRVPRAGSQFNDGSGLSRRNRASALTEVRLLKALASGPLAAPYRTTLSVAAYDGTLRGRMHGTAAESNITAKTGTLRSVSALAGYATTADGEPLAFAFISNGGGGFKSSENAAATLLAGFTYRYVQEAEPAPPTPPKKQKVQKAPKKKKAAPAKRSRRSRRR
jgi:D-alanyl-D-alanine carboxypeptidase/D-alanyl-D-alanine-endopeptidase (penicillin-binding protein 4)